MMVTAVAQKMQHRVMVMTSGSQQDATSNVRKKMRPKIILSRPIHYGIK